MSEIKAETALWRASSGSIMGHRESKSRSRSLGDSTMKASDAMRTESPGRIEAQRLPRRSRQTRAPPLARLRSKEKEKMSN
eukprot:5587807-Pleurochrysis_carterae.AAC.2